MKCIQQREMATLTVSKENIVHLPLGLLGFEQIKKYVLLSKPDEAPFAWFQMLEKPNLAFLVVPSTEASAAYQPEMSDQDAEFLDLKNPDDALVYNIVTLGPNNTATANLKGPIVLNRWTLRGKQIVPLNAASYSLKHPLSTCE